MFIHKYRLIKQNTHTKKTLSMASVMKEHHCNILCVRPNLCVLLQHSLYLFTTFYSL